MFQTETIPRQLSLAVGASVVEVSPETGTNQRTLLCLSNVSIGGQIIYIGVGADAVANAGIVLQPTESYTEAIDTAFTPSNLRFTALASAAGGVLAIHERIAPVRA